MITLLRKIWNSKVALIIISFICGGLTFHLLGPEKIKIEIKKEIQYVDKIIVKTVVKWKTKTVYKEREVKKTKHTIEYPDGRKETTEVFESNTMQVSKIEEQYKSLLDQKESEFNQKYSYLKEKMRPKRYQLYGGLGLSALKLAPSYLVGVNAGLFGPFTVGMAVTSDFQDEVGIFGTFGLQF